MLEIRWWLISNINDDDGNDNDGDDDNDDDDDEDYNVCFIYFPNIYCFMNTYFSFILFISTFRSGPDSSNG